MLKSSYTNDLLEVGCDEAGRGCLAGPVFAAAVILPKKYKSELINDSKKTSEKQRIELKEIIENNAIAYSVQFINHNEIDIINILNASIKAMHKAINTLSLIPNFILVDGNRFKKYKDIKHECIIKGDSKFLSIAAASILAKTYRDEYMKKIHHEFPEYNWKQNKGYPTKEHREAIRKHGISKYHRLSFKINEQLKLSL